MALERIRIKRWGMLVFLLAALLLCPGGRGWAQTEEYRVNVKKNFGFNNGSQIRGSFTASVEGGEDIRRVTFFIDGSLVGADTSDPYGIEFKTQDYSLGWHSISAKIEKTDGKVIETSERKFEFVSAEVEADFVKKIVIPLIGGIWLLVLLGIGIQFLITGKSSFPRREPGTRITYGMKGGAICPNCGHPTSLHWWSANLLFVVFDRCNTCGKWGFLRRTSWEVLRAAEDAEMTPEEETAPGSAGDAEEALKRQIEDTRYIK